MSEAHDGAPEGVTEDTAAADQVADQTDAQVQEGDTGDDAAAAETEGAGEQPKPRKSAQERIAELTAARREAEREAEFWRSKATQAPQPAQQLKAEDDEPDPSAYEHGELDARYIRDHATYHATKTFARQQAELEARQRTQAAVQTFEQRLVEQFPDGEPEGLARLRAMPELSAVVQETILDSDIGPQLADHLGQNLRDLARISALPPIKQARELAKLELKLATPPAPSPKTATDAPAPTPQVRGTGGRFKPAPDTDDFAAFEKTYG
jgi:hypothetical protein